MRPRSTGPALSVAGVLDALQALSKAANEAASLAGPPRNTFDLVGLRASQINGSAVRLDMHGRAVEKASEVDGRLFTLAAWREAPYFSTAERAALVVCIAAINAWNRLNVATGQIAAEWTAQWVA